MLFHSIFVPCIFVLIQSGGGNHFQKPEVEQKNLTTSDSDENFEIDDLSSHNRGDLSVTVVSGERSRTVDVFSKPNQRGQRFTASLTTGCRNVQRRARRRLKSIQTRGSCAVAFRKRDCEGDGLILLQHSIEARNLKASMGQDPVSMRLCSENDFYKAEFFSHSNFRGKRDVVDLPFSGACRNLKKALANTASSAHLFDDSACMVVYTDQYCSGDRLRLYPSTRGINDFSELGINDDIESVRICRGVDLGQMMYMDIMPMATSNSEIPPHKEAKDTPKIEWEPTSSINASTSTSERSSTVMPKQESQEKRRMDSKSEF